MSPTPTSGKVVFGILIVSASAAAFVSSIYPLLIAPPETKQRDRAPTGGLQRRGVWANIDKK